MSLHFAGYADNILSTKCVICRHAIFTYHFRFLHYFIPYLYQLCLYPNEQKSYLKQRKNIRFDSFSYNFVFTHHMMRLERDTLLQLHHHNVYFLLTRLAFCVGILYYGLLQTEVYRKNVAIWQQTPQGPVICLIKEKRIGGRGREFLGMEKHAKLYTF